jgi:hypothetical protein
VGTLVTGYLQIEASREAHEASRREAHEASREAREACRQTQQACRGAPQAAREVLTVLGVVVAFRRASPVVCVVVVVRLVVEELSSSHRQRVPVFGPTRWGRQSVRGRNACQVSEATCQSDILSTHVPKEREGVCGLEETRGGRAPPNASFRGDRFDLRKAVGLRLGVLGEAEHGTCMHDPLLGDAEEVAELCGRWK